MDLIRLVIQTTVTILNTRLTFGGFSFTLLSASLAISVLGVVVYFIKTIFAED